MLKTHVRPCVSSPISNSSTYSISNSGIFYHLIFILLQHIFITYSDDYNSNNQGSFSSRQLNNRGFPFGVLNRLIRATKNRIINPVLVLTLFFRVRHQLSRIRQLLYYSSNCLFHNQRVIFLKACQYFPP